MYRAVNDSALVVYSFRFFRCTHPVHAGSTLCLILQDRCHLLHYVVQALLPCAAIHPQGHLAHGRPRQGLRLFHCGSHLDHRVNIRQSYGVKVELAPYGFLGQTSGITYSLPSIPDLPAVDRG
jgi:hypothetical protein